MQSNNQTPFVHHAIAAWQYNWRFIGQNSSANGNSVRFAQVYNFIERGAFAIGSASQDYITNTHTKYANA